MEGNKLSLHAVSKISRTVSNTLPTDIKREVYYDTYILIQYTNEPTLLPEQKIAYGTIAAIVQDQKVGIFLFFSRK